MKSNRKSKSFNSETKSGFLFALPWMIGFLVFSFYPIAMSAYYSFTDFNAIKKPTWVGFDNYAHLFADSLFYKSMANTLIYVVVSVPLTIMLALIMAMLLNLKIKGRALFRSIFFIPSILPLVASTMIWIWILDPLDGYLNKALKIFGVPTINWLGNPRFTHWSIILISLWGIGTTMVIFLAAIQDVPRELYEASSIDGANTIKKFFHITIPGIAHIMLYQIILAVINGFQYFSQVYIIITAQSGNLVQGAQGGPQNSLLMYPLYLYYNAFSFLKMGRASAMAWILFLIVGFLSILLVKGSKKWVYLK